jgi:nitroimidazol reductase NimA-like FMN-containing flavoprotein (pyridoxamine 5'-phosphate oxidase superfamily)
MTRDEMEKLLGEEEVGYLGMCRGDEPYVVPLSYVFADGKIIFHGKLSGRKIEFVRANPRVSFAVSRHPDRTMPHRADGECNYRYESVICSGRARIVEDAGERLEYLRKFKAHFDEVRGLDPAHGRVPENAPGKTSIIIIDVEEMTGRRKGDA